MSPERTVNEMTRARAAAWWALEHGLKIFPCYWIEDGHCACGNPACDRPGKHPMVENGHLSAAEQTPVDVVEFWTKYPKATIGMPCRMNKRVVIDIDPKNGGVESIKALEAAVGPIVSPWSYLTGSGGEHRHVQDPGGDLHGTLKDYPGIDFKCEGYVILPPSSHISGGQYRLTEQSDLTQPVPPMPEALRLLLTKTNGSVPSAPETDASGILRAAILTAAFAPAPDSGVRDFFYGALAGGLGRTLNDDDLLLQFIHEAATAAGDEDEATSGKRTDFARRTLEKLRAGDPEITGLPEAIRLAKDGFADVLDQITHLLRGLTTAVPDLSVEVGRDLKFPDSAIIGLGREFTDLYSANYEAPPVFWYHAFLTFLGAWLSKKVVLGGTNEPPRLYTTLLGLSAWSRKSSSQDDTEDFFARVQNEYYGQMSAVQAAETGAPSILHGSGSAEGLAKRIQRDQKRPILMKFDELKSLIDKGRQDGSQLMPLLTNTWGKGRWSNETLTYSIELTDAAISLLSACTLKTFESAFRGAEADIGFLNRLWIAPGRSDRVIDVPEAPSAEARDKLVKKVVEAIRGLVAVDGGMTQAVFAPDARAFWKAWYTEFQRRVAMSETAARIDSYGLRLCILLAACEQTTLNSQLVITPLVVGAVIQMLEWQMKVREQFYPTIADNQTAAMEQKIRKVLTRAPGQWVRRKDVYNNANGHRAGMPTFDKALDGLIRNAEIELRSEQHKFSKNVIRWYRLIEELGSQGVTAP